MIYAIAFCLYSAAGGATPIHCRVVPTPELQSALACRAKLLTTFIDNNTDTLKYMCVTREAGGWRQML